MFCCQLFCDCFGLTHHCPCTCQTCTCQIRTCQNCESPMYTEYFNLQSHCVQNISHWYQNQLANWHFLYSPVCSDSPWFLRSCGESEKSRGKRKIFVCCVSSFCPEILLWHTSSTLVPLKLVAQTSKKYCTAMCVSCVCLSALVCQPSLIFVHFLSQAPMVPTVHVVLSPAAIFPKQNLLMPKAAHLTVQNPYFLAFLLRFYIFN